MDVPETRHTCSEKVKKACFYAIPIFGVTYLLTYKVKGEPKMIQAEVKSTNMKCEMKTDIARQEWKD